MQALIELIAGFIALVFAAALAQVGVDLHAPRHADREVHRVGDCGEARPAQSVLTTDKARNC